VLSICGGGSCCVCCGIEGGSGVDWRLVICEIEGGWEDGGACATFSFSVEPRVII